MKKLLYSSVLALGALTFTQCDDWTDMENKFEEPYNSHNSEYYEALRAYKNSDHSICFGWFSGWTGMGDNMYNMLRGIPDSMDVVSLWDGAFDLTPEKLEDLKEVREIKGTRILYCQFIISLGDRMTPKEVENDFIVNGQKYNSRDEAMAAYWGWYNNHGDTSKEGIEKAIRKYARVIADTINHYGYDGFDIDYEPHYGYSGNITDPDRMHILLDELSKSFGPKSGTGRILMVDGEPQTLNAESGPLVDYFNIQAYSSRGDYDLDNRFNGLLNKFSSTAAGNTPEEKEAAIFKKTIWSENFEKHKSDGGPEFTTRDGIKVRSLKGMALYYRPNVKDARIGGVGAYRFNLCRPINDYLFMRGAIQTLNPAQH